MSSENRWVKKASSIPWDAIEDRYAKLFPSKTGMPAKPLRMALGSLLIQRQLDVSDRELLEEIRENPYLQYFIGLPGYRYDLPFAPSLLVEFRKRLTPEILGDINEMIISFNAPDDDDTPGAGSGSSGETDDDSPENSGTLILDATCVPQNIAYPQDTNLLNEARENLERMIDELCHLYNQNRPRMYRQNARRDYLNFARSRKKSIKKIRKTIKQQLQYIRRDRRYIREFLDAGMELNEHQMQRLAVIDIVIDQQQYMYDNKTHTVADRIVSISQPHIRPIVRGKAAAPVEFGAKFDLSLDENGLGRIEKMSFDPYNESDVLIGAIQNYHTRTGHYPQRVLADKIYRNRNNLAFCKEHGIRLLGSALGRPKKNSEIDRVQEYIDNTDRVEVERAFSLVKRSYGLGKLRTKLGTTSMSSIALSIIAMNVDHLTRFSLLEILISIFSRFRGYQIQSERYEICKMAG